MLVRKFLDLSITHLTPETRSKIEVGDLVLAYPHPEELGWFCYVSNEPESDHENYPPDLVQCFVIARAQGCDYILFDIDAEVLEGLPIYDDEEESTPRPPEFDNSRADEEGWAIFGLAPAGPPFQLQKCDDAGLFNDDEEAWKFVVDKAKEGSLYHQQALEFLKKHTPAEYRAITDCYPYPSEDERREESTHGTQDPAGEAGRPRDAADRHSDGEGSEEALQERRRSLDGAST